MSKEEKIKKVAEKLESISKLMVNPELKELSKLLSENEDPEDMVQGTYHKKQGLLIATNVRLIFIHKGLLFGMTVQDFSYDKITSIEYKTGLIDGSLTIYATGNIEEIRNVTPKSRVKEFGEFVRKKLGQKRADQTSVQAITTVEQLEKLAALKEKGLLTDEEFRVQKEKLL